MTDRPTHSAAAAVTDEAVAWLLRLRDPSCTRRERRQFEAWLKADASHAREYETLLEVWTLSGNLQPTFAIRARRFVGWPALVCVLAFGALLAWYTGWLPSSYKRYTTHADIENITLPDGSKAQLGTDTSLAFVRFRDRHEIRFRRGEALFDVRADATPALDILVGRGRMAAAGARFNLWYDEERVVVTPVEGSLEIQGDVGRTDQAPVPLSVGQQARFSAAATMPQVSSANLERTLAWRQGKLILSDIELADALPLINRYLDRPLRLGDDAAANVTIGGIYDTSDMEGLVRALPKIAPVRISEDRDGSTVIYSVPRRSM